MKANGVKIEGQNLQSAYKELCDLIGYEAVEKLYLRYRGGYISLPKKFFIDEFVHSYIVTRYINGNNANEMAREYDFTYSWIMKLVRKARVNNNQT